MTAAKPRPVTRRRSPEHDEQSQLIRWRDLFAPTEPRLKWLHHIPNGAIHPGANATPQERALAAKVGAQWKARGLTAGVWDLFLPVTAMLLAPGASHLNQRRCGLYIEMKAGKNGLTSDQSMFRDALELQYRFVVCRSWIEAATAICDYLRLPDDHPARRAAQ